MVVTSVVIMFVITAMISMIIIIVISSTSLDSMQAEAGQGQGSGDEGRHCFAIFICKSSAALLSANPCYTNCSSILPAKVKYRAAKLSANL